MDYRYTTRPPPPPPPPPSDPHQQPPLPPPPGPWYSGQFQYHSPSPPPPQWGPPPPYSQQQPHYPHPVNNQEWNHINSNAASWSHQAWDYSAHNQNEDDLAARARAWAASKAVTNDQQQPYPLPASQGQYSQNPETPYQQQQPHSVPANRPEEINYQGQYSQNPEPPYQEFQQNSHYPPNYQQYSSFPPPPPGPPANHVQESSSFGSGYTSDGHFSYAARDGNLRETAAAYSHQDNGPTSFSDHQQEVPSSYSSVAGKEELRDLNGSYQPSHMPYAPAPQHQAQPSISHNDRSMSIEQPQYAYINSSAEPTTDLSNQPLDFGPRYGHDHDPFGQSKYGQEHGGPTGGIPSATAIPSVDAWTSSAAPGMPCPSMPPVYPAGQQMAGSGFQPTMSSTNTTFPMETSNAFHATNPFPGDAYGTPGFLDRPKKAPVPNWLREEIIKKKAVIGSSSRELSRQDADNEDDVMDRPIGKGDQESSRSTEEEDEDEDQVESARNAAINQEIKRILTEVLLKVTDELFDDIATEVLEEDDLKVEVEHKAVTSSDMKSVSSSAVITPKSSAKVLIPVKTKQTDLDDVSGKSSSSSPGDVLGLGNYASDDDEEEKEVQNSSVPSSNSIEPTVHPVNGTSQGDKGDVPIKEQLKEESDSHGVGANGATGDHNDNSSGEKVKPDASDVSKSKQNVGDRDVDKHEVLFKGGLTTTENLLPDDAQVRSPRNGVDRNDSKRRSSSKDYNGELESGKHKKQTKVDENNKIQDERHIKRAKKDDQNSSEEKNKERDSGKTVSRIESKDDKKDRDKDRRSHGKEEDRKRERGKEAKNERSKYKSGDSSRHKRHHSPSPGGRHRSSKDNSSLSHDSSSSDSKRKGCSKRRDRSPSPVRSRRRVSRSPPSKRSQHRHSIYSSVEIARERRRSRSRSRRG